MNTIDAISDRSRLQATRAKATRLLRRLVGIFERMEARLEKQRTRRSLLEMSDEQLKDIGISRADAYREASKTLWE